MSIFLLHDILLCTTTVKHVLWNVAMFVRHIFCSLVTNTTPYRLGRYSLHLLLQKSSMSCPFMFVFFLRLNLLRFLLHPHLPSLSLFLSLLSNHAMHRFSHSRSGQRRRRRCRWCKAETSVTRWLDYFFNIWPFRIMKICPTIIKYLAK